MRTILRAWVVLLLAVPLWTHQAHADEGTTAETPEPTTAPPSGDGVVPLNAYWKGGLRFRSEDGDFAIRLGGRIHSDWAVAFSDDALQSDFDGVSDVDSGTGFRRARLNLQGTIYRNFVFRAEYDFVGGDAEPKDVYLGVRSLPVVGTLLVGHFKEPFSMETIASANDITMIERGLPHALVPFRNAGVMARNSVLDERATWSLGVLRDVDDTGDGFGSDSKWNVTGRLTGLPVWHDDGETLVHLGLAYSHQFREDDEVRFSSRPEASLYGARLVDTGAVASDGVDLLGAEVAAVHGPYSLQAEFVQAWVDGVEDDAAWSGAYVKAGWFLTGETRPYDTGEAVFDGVEPARDFSPTSGGWGAWELAARYSFLDLDGEGGRLDDVTVGLNWYLNPVVRVMMNYVYGDVDDSGAAHILQARFQLAI